MNLPFELITQVLEQFVNGLDREIVFDDATATERYLKSSSYKELSELRLISRIWSKAVIPFYFQTVLINSSRRAQLILDNWNDDLFSSLGSCPVQRLTIEKLWYKNKKRKDGTTDEGGNIFLKQVPKGSLPVTMDQLIRLIRLLGMNLKTLNITFFNCMAISPDLIPAIQTIKDLKSLTISFDCDGVNYGTYDFNSLSGLFSVIPNLEYLSTHHDQMNAFKLNPPALSNLRYFSLQCDEENLKGNIHITQTAKNTLKMIELAHGYIVPIEGLKQILEPIQDTLEGLFTIRFTDQVIKKVQNMNFPRLRVIKTQFDDEFIPEIKWLKAPMLKNVRTIINPIVDSQDYWFEALERAGVNALKKVPNFKHIVFTNDEHNESQDLDPELMDLFKSHGVQCHVTDHGLTADEIMALDYDLNGMN